MYVILSDVFSWRQWDGHWDNTSSQIAKKQSCQYGGILQLNTSENTWIEVYVLLVWERAHLATGQDDILIDFLLSSPSYFKYPFSFTDQWTIKSNREYALIQLDIL